MSVSHLAWAAALVLFLAGAAGAQTTLNPDISLIGNLQSLWNNNEADPQSKQLNLNLDEIEVAVSGYLNPYARADVFISWHGEQTEVEEAYVTFTRGIPFGLTVKAGQYRLGFGHINPTHPHAYSFILQPLPNQEFFGDEGLRDVGIHASIALPTGNVETSVSADLLKGDFLDFPAVVAIPVSAQTADATSRPNKRAFAARWNSFFTLGEYTSLNLGATAVTGIPAEGERRWIGGADCKFHWRPNRYQSFNSVVEWTFNRQLYPLPPDTRPGDDHPTRHGLFGYAEYQFRQRFNFGGVGEWTQLPQYVTAKIWRLGEFVGFAPVEETSLVRLLVDYQRDPAAGDGFWAATLQLIYSLGPHKPHSF
ncbi:MAG: hypothetical protein HY304_09630 [candidate division Zixibacteria bacterium]|nr:hypothetical protein [candidate division Zixibacteria bacterium]